MSSLTQMVASPQVERRFFGNFIENSAWAVVTRGILRFLQIPRAKRAVIRVWAWTISGFSSSAYRLMSFLARARLTGLGENLECSGGRGSHFMPFWAIFSAVSPHADATATSQPRAASSSASVSTWLSAPPTPSESTSINIFIF